MDISILRTCKHCQLPKTFEELVKDKRKKDGVIAICKVCSHKQTKARPSYEKSKEEINRRYREDNVFAERKKLSRQKYHLDYLPRVILSNAKVRARRMGIEFNLEESDIIIPEFCPLLNIPIYRGTNTVKGNSPSLDRKDTRLGYIKGNVQIISYKANTMKSDATPDELKNFIANLSKYLNNDIV